jgi:uncharacterized protein DUF955
MAKRIRLRFADDIPAAHFWRDIERLARVDRRMLGYRFDEPSDPRELAPLYDVHRILETSEEYEACYGRDVSRVFDGLDGLSGILLPLPDGCYWILVNPTHSRTRRTLTIAHEFGHIIRGHQPLEIERIGLVGRPLYSGLQEDEAFGYGLAFLLPYAPLLQMLRQSASVEAIAHHYSVSVPAVEMRLKRTGLWSLRKT